ncbi:hypothetical protein BACCIP111895_04242 [Neobacillus rhizosphaerae]|uniref:Uncharacterized protein n=1 Tax=Neobacillus rhizosphaerae TaxID=2880965 RepID=A0ABM9EXY1_9BACI|nr:hypothetical protein BACCIP111895_04242 [Neobacillus rhizosphaerae]
MNEKTNNVEAQTERLNAFERLTKNAVWPAYLGCIWAVMYAVFVRFYQAAGGTLGIPGQVEDPKGMYMASYFAGVLIMTCGVHFNCSCQAMGKGSSGMGAVNWRKTLPPSHYINPYSFLYCLFNCTWNQRDHYKSPSSSRCYYHSFHWLDFT